MRAATDTKKKSMPQSMQQNRSLSISIQLRSVPKAKPSGIIRFAKQRARLTRESCTDKRLVSRPPGMPELMPFKCRITAVSPDPPPNSSDDNMESDSAAKPDVDFEGDESSDDNIDADAGNWNVEPEDDEAARSLIGDLSDRIDCEDGPPENVDEIHDLIRFLWFGKHFQMNTVDAVARGHARLASVLAEVRWIRDRFNSGGNPVGDRRLTTKEVTDIYNNYRDDMSWMPRNVWSQYEAEAKGEGKGKNKGSKKPVSFSQQAHQ